MSTDEGSFGIISTFTPANDCHAVIVTQKSAFWEWAFSFDLCDRSDRPRGDEGRVFLIGDDDYDNWIEKNWLYLFEHELGIWSSDIGEWPTKRTRDVFNEMFSVQLCYGVFYLRGANLKKIYDDAIKVRELDAGRKHQGLNDNSPTHGFAGGEN
jgi:hypothetical protein